MELVALLRLLWRHRALVALGLVAATVAALMLAPGKSESFAVASGRVVVDTAESQLLNAEPEGADTLPWRAGMLADLAGSQSATSQIAGDVGVAPESVVVTAPHLAVPEAETPLSVSALDAAAATSHPHVVAVGLVDERLPIISVDSRAPDRAGAARLVTATVNALRTLAWAPNRGADRQTLAVETLGPARTTELGGEPRRLAAMGVFGAAFGLWCVGMALALGIKRLSRQREWRDEPAAPSDAWARSFADLEPHKNGSGQRVVRAYRGS
jgi:hypothetical protein